MAALLTFSACGQGTAQVIAIVPNFKAAGATQAILEAYFSAYQFHDVDKMMSFYADNVVWMDYGMNDGPYGKSDVDSMNRA
jgi:ketosteroid isomerase-like protein